MTKEICIRKEEFIPAKRISIFKRGSFSTDGNNNLEFICGGERKLPVIKCNGLEDYEFDSSIFDGWWRSLFAVNMLRVVEDGGNYMMLDGTHYEITIQSFSSSVTVCLSNPEHAEGYSETKKLLDVINMMFDFARAHGREDKGVQRMNKELMVI